MKNQEVDYHVSARRLRKMLKKLKYNKTEVVITWDWSNDENYTEYHRDQGVIKDYDVTVTRCSDFRAPDYYSYKVKIVLEDGKVIEDEIDSHWEFGKCDKDQTVMFINTCGPNCYYVFCTVESIHRRKFKKAEEEHGCGYWDLCDDRACPCSPNAPVSQGFSEEVWKRMLRNAREEEHD